MIFFEAFYHTHRYTNAKLPFFTYELTLILPLLYVWYAICLTQSNKKYAMKQALLFFIPLGIYLLLRFGYTNNTFSLQYVNNNFSTTLLVMLSIFFLYTRLLFFPLTLAPYYEIIPGITTIIEFQKEEAKKLLIRILSVQPEHTDAANNMGAILASEGNYEEAWKILTAAVKIVTDDPDLYLNLANVDVALGKNDEAVILLKKALSIKPDFPNAISLLDSLSK
jgi:tetratricopeptide (TPR) repeat protein